MGHTDSIIIIRQTNWHTRQTLQYMTQTMSYRRQTLVDKDDDERHTTMTKNKKNRVIYKKQDKPLTDLLYRWCSYSSRDGHTFIPPTQGRVCYLGGPGYLTVSVVFHRPPAVTPGGTLHGWAGRTAQSECVDNFKTRGGVEFWDLFIWLTYNDRRREWYMSHEWAADTDNCHVWHPLESDTLYPVEVCMLG